MSCRSHTPIALFGVLTLISLASGCSESRRVVPPNNNNNNSGKDAGSNDGGGGNGDGSVETDAGMMGANGTPCADGRVLCNGRCVNTSDDARHCGMCNRGCQAGQVCTSSQAAPMCTRVENCPTNGCSGFAYCDIGSRNCLPGCVRDDQCGSNEACNLQVHDCDCKAGFHRCGGICVTDNDVNTCGGRCSACPSDPNGTASCGGGQCMLSCGGGFQVCGERCTRPTDPSACGPSCTVCPGDAHGQATCDGTSCGIACENGFHLCNGSCVSNNATDSCGGNCSPCPTDGNGSASCDGTSCNLACNQGYRLCDGACAQCPNVASTTCNGGSCVAAPCQANQELCGANCVNCPMDQHLSSVRCNGNNQCEIATCQQGYLLCNGACSQCPTGASVNATACGATGQCEATSCADNSRFCPSGCCGLTDAELDFASAEKGVRIALTDSNEAHVLYQDRSGSPYGLKHGVAGSSFSAETLVVGVDSRTPTYFDLAVEGNNVHVLYINEVDTFNRELIYTVKTGNGSFMPAMFNTDPLNLAPVYMRTRPGSGGAKLYLTFSVSNAQGRDEVFVGYNEGSGWNVFHTEMVNIRGYDVAIDPTTDRPVLVIAGTDVLDEVRVVHFASDGTPSATQVERARPTGNPQIAVDATGTVHVAYAAGSIRYASGTTSFSPQTLAAGTTVAELEVDGMGRPHVLYGADLTMGMSYTESTGQGFRTVNIPLLRRLAFNDDSDFALDSSGAPIFVYSLNGTNTLRWLH